MKRFELNNEFAFVIALNSDKPKLSKSTETLYLDPDKAFADCEELNLKADPTGKKKEFAVFNINAQFAYRWESKEEFDKSQEDKDFKDSEWLRN